MKKIKLYAIGNEGNFNYYVFDKKNETIKTLAKLLSKIIKVDWHLHRTTKDQRQVKINFEKIKEHHESLKKKGKTNRIDIFYGTKKIFITIHCPKNTRKKFNTELGEISYMPKPKEFKEK